MSEFEQNEQISEQVEQPVVPSPVKRKIKIIETYEDKTAGFWIRFWAFILDSLVVAAVVGILVNPIFHLFDWSLDDTKWYAPIGIVSAIFYYTYFILMTKFYQQTLGKMVFGLKVVQVNGEKLTWLTVVFRELISRFISNKIPVIYIMVAFMPKNQSLSDIIADTTVIQEKVYVKGQKKVIEEVPYTKEQQSISSTI